MTRAEWRPWWLEAEEQYAVAAELLASAHHSASVSHALMCAELAVKALNAAPTTWGALRVSNTTWPELKPYTWADLEGGLGLTRGHRPTLTAPWLRNIPVAEVALAVAAVEVDLGLGNGDLYQACRYPDGWPDAAVVPHLKIGEQHARQIFEAVDVFLRSCREYLGRHPDTDPGIP